jgi:hemerythrin
MTPMQDYNKRHILNIPEMDTQHAYLYGLFDHIEDTIEVVDKKATGKLLNEIEGYLLFHFTSEEHLMRLYKVPGYSAHQTEHEQAGARLVMFMDDFSREQLNPAKMRIYLTGWLMEHSQISDEEYAKVIRNLRNG